MEHDSARPGGLVSEAADQLGVELATTLREQRDSREGMGEVDTSIADALRWTHNAVHDPVLGDVDVGVGIGGRGLLPATHLQALVVDRRTSGPLVDDDEGVALDVDVLDRSPEHAFGELDVQRVAADELLLATLAHFEQVIPCFQ